jgi:uncharacterized protein
MSDDVVRRAARWVYEAAPAEQKSISFLWHAGEPLTAGQGFYKRAFRIIEDELRDKVNVRFIFQTNATLITDSWCDLFDKHQVTIGVSLDGPRDIHDINRLSWSRRGSFDRSMRGVEVLRRRGYNPPAICVLTPRSLTEPDAIYDFFFSNNFPSVGFNVEETEGAHSGARDFDALPSEMRGAYVRFMRQIWKRQRKDGSRLRVREFERTLSVIEGLRRDRDFVATPDEVIPFANVLINRDGAISTFAPELSSTLSSEYNNFIIGSVFDTPLEVRTGAALACLERDLEAGRRACQATCAYYPVCGGGYQSNRYAEHNSLQATETSTCRLQRKALTDMVLTELSYL